MRLNEIFILMFLLSLQNKQKPIRNSSCSNLWSTPLLILWNIEFKVLSKKPSDEAFRVSFKLPRHGWYQRLADFNRFSSIETRSCYSCLVLYLHALVRWEYKSGIISSRLSSAGFCSYLPQPTKNHSLLQSYWFRRNFVLHLRNFSSTRFGIMDCYILWTFSRETQVVRV